MLFLLLLLLIPEQRYSLHFTAVPPSTNPSSKLNRLFLLELHEKLHADVVEINDGRIRFCPTDATPLYQQWPSLLQTSVRSVRTIVGEYCDLKSTEQIDDLVDNKVDIDAIVSALQIWQQFGNTVRPSPDTISFHLEGRKWQSSSIEDISMRNLTNALSYKIAASTGWSISSKKRSANISLHALLYNNTLLLELVLLVPPTGTQADLPKPGMKREESYLVAKTASILSSDVVLDPMCGCATFLIEAATHWLDDVTYIGIDTCENQLDNAQMNVEATGVSVELRHGDATNLMDFEEDSVDKILCCPPFGRQFGSLENNKVLYQNLLKEWSRIIKAETGRMVLLVDEANIDILLDGIQEVGCHADFCRDFFRLGKIQATVVVVSKTTTTKKQRTNYGRLDWEMRHSGRDRALWARLRAEALPSLVPFTASVRHRS